MAANKTVRIGPQPGPQHQFLASKADITFYGGAAGGGKTYGMLLSPLRSIHRPDFQSVIFRNTSPEIRIPGGMWDESMQLYPQFGGVPRDTFLDWSFPTGAYFKFAGLQYEKDLLDWQGSQIPHIGFDQVENFSRRKFFYMLSRNRSTTGIPGYIQATCNPDPDSWVAEFISWWIDQDTGLPYYERSGALRWFCQISDQIHWADTPTELIEAYGKDTMPKSVTFIPSRLSDNQILMMKDPTYLANLKALSLVDQERLLHGNWKVRPSAGLLFRREWCPAFEAPPADIVTTLRRWDLAGTPKRDDNDPDWTVGVKLARRPIGTRPRYVILDVIRLRAEPDHVKQAIKNAAMADGIACSVYLPRDPGQAGKFQVQDFIQAMDGYTVKGQRETGKKLIRFKPFSAQCLNGNVGYIKGPWNEAFFLSLEAFPEPTAHDDDADACSGAYMAYVDSSTGLLDYYEQEAIRLREKQLERERGEGNTSQS